MLERLKSIIFWCALVVFTFAALHFLEQIWTLQELQALVQQQPIVTSLVYAMLFILVGTFCLPGSGPLTVAAGAIFGFWWGVILVSFASAIGATLAMQLTRRYFQPWVRTKFHKMENSILQGLEKEGTWYLISIRLAPVIPYFLVNLVFGLTKMSVQKFYIFTQLGMFAGVSVYVNAGTQLQSLDSSDLSSVLSFNIISSLLLLASFPWLVRILLLRMNLIRVECTNGN